MSWENIESFIGKIAREENYDLFNDTLSWLNVKLERSGKFNLLSGAVHAEEVYRRILNELYGWNLQNADWEHHNVAVTDLWDHAERLLVQVTIQCKPKKVSETLSNRKMAEYAEMGYRIKFVFVGKQWEAIKTSRAIRIPECVAFDKENDLLLTDDLVKEFTRLTPTKQDAVLRVVDEELGRGKRASVTSTDAREVNERLKVIRKGHPSFRLMDNGAEEALLPKGILQGNGNEDFATDTGALYTAESEGVVSLERVLSECLRSEKQTHLVITGKGGIGKTVALLTLTTKEGFLPENVPVAYVRLWQLAYRTTKKGKLIEIDKHLRKTYPRGEALVELSKRRWASGPCVILLLDGFNEVPEKQRSDVDNAIREWAELRPGAQIITTSRIGCLEGMPNAKTLELQELSQDEIKGYLSQRRLVNSEGEDVNWRILGTPLMLKIYTNVKLFLQKINASWIRMRPASSEGNLIWNYLQHELYKCVQTRQGRFGRVEYAAAMMLVLPFVCWRMAVGQLFDLEGASFVEHIEEACKYWYGRRLPKYFKHVEWCFGEHLEELRIQHLIDSQVSIITNETGLIFWNATERAYSLMHQVFRDGLAAIHMKNLIECAKGAPIDELNVWIPSEVKDCLSDMFSLDAHEDDLLKAAWESNRKNPTTEVIATHNLIRVFFRLYDGNLSNLNWSGMDLRGISLFRHRKDMRAHLSARASNFTKTKLDKGCFEPIGHSSTVHSLCLCKDSKIIASCSKDGTIRLWDVTGRVQVGKNMRAYAGRVLSVCCSSDGLLVAGYEDGSIRLWDISSCTQISQPLTVCAETPVHQDYWWDITAYKQVNQAFYCGCGPVYSICFTPDGVLAAGYADGAIRLWDTANCEQVRDPMICSDGSVLSVSVSPSGILAAGYADGTVRLWDVSSRKQIGEPMLREESPARSVCFSKRGVLAIGYHNGITHLWDASNCEPLGEPFEGHLGCVWQACFSPDGQLLATGADDGTVRLWDVEHHVQSGDPIVIPGGAVHTVSFVPENNLVVTGSSDGSIQFWDLRRRRRNGMPIGGCGGAVTSVCSSPTGYTIAYGLWDSTVRLFDLEKRLQIGELMGGDYGWVKSVLFSNHGTTVACGYSDGKIRVWDRRTHHQEGSTVSCSDIELFSLRTTSNGSRMAACLWDGSIRIWDASSHRQIGDDIYVPGGKTASLSTSPDDKLIVTVSIDGTIRLWSIESHLQVGNAISRCGERVSRVCFTKNQNRVVTGSEDGTICVWDISTGSIIGEPLRGGDGLVWCLCISPVENLVASGFSNGTIKIWDVSNDVLAIVPPLQGHTAAVRSICFSSDGKMLISGSRDGTLRIWDVHTGEQLEVITPLHGIDISGLDFSEADIESETDRKVFLQNGAKVKPS